MFVNKWKSIREIEQVSLSFEATKEQKFILGELNGAKTETVSNLLIRDLKQTPLKFFEFSRVHERTAIGVLTQI